MATLWFYDYALTFEDEVPAFHDNERLRNEPNHRA